MLRACVGFNVWRFRCEDLPPPSPWTIAVKAALVAQLHMHHSLVQELELRRLLAQHEWPRRDLVPRITHATSFG